MNEQPALTESMVNQERYTPDGDAAAELRIANDQLLIGKAVAELIEPRHFCALVMIGGYARGEGGIVWHKGQPAPYNDYDYFVIVKGLNRHARNALKRELAGLAETLGEQVGVEVDLEILRSEALPTASPSLMFAEMQWGHTVVAGDSKVLSSMPKMPISTLPLGEFTRLMLNRGTLLLLNQQAAQRGQFHEASDRDRFIKYLFKAILACGDAKLAVAGNYHPLYRVKWERLNQLPGIDADFLRQYEYALSGKFYPDAKQFAHTDLLAWQQQTIDFWSRSLSSLESHRLNKPVMTWQQYASPSIDKGQSDHSLTGTLTNIAITFRDYGALELLRNPHWSRLYPRERLISILPTLLLAAAANSRTEPEHILGFNGAKTGRSVQERYLEQWQRYA